MPATSFMGIQGHRRATLQAYVLIGLGLLFLLGALFLHLNPLASPVGLFLFGFGMLIAMAFNPSRLAIAGVLITLIGAAIFIAYKPLIPYDNGLVIIAVGLALLVLAFLTRQGYVGGGAITPGILVLLVGFLLYPPTGGAADRMFAPFVLSLWFPGILLLLIGLVYWFLSRKSSER
ncbi:MAG TPA: hypothetical protein VGD98_12465 [Ktedonobacteraceae bacterium]